MAKYKAKIKDNHLYVLAKTAKDETVSVPEIDYLSKNFIRGILKPELKGRNKILFYGPVSVALSEHLKKPMTRHEFYLIVSQLLDISKRVAKKNLYASKLVFDLDNIYINATTKELQFIYLPFASVAKGTDLFEFLREFIYRVTPVDGKESEHLSKFLFFLNSLQFFDMEKIEAYIRKEDRAAFDTVSRQESGHSGYMTDKQKDYYEHYDAKSNAGDDDATGLLANETFESGNMDDATGLLACDPFGDDDTEDETGLLSEDDMPSDFKNPMRPEYQQHYPSLRRIMTDEIIQINKPVFRIGKEKSYVDYFVSYNNVVSRSHADIITRGNRYFIIDLNSKNKTYVNDKVIPVQCEIEIFDNDKIRLANEEFVFSV